MGTDIYLIWDGMTEEEIKKNYTEIRANMMDFVELTILKKIFPIELWDYKEHKINFFLLFKNYHPEKWVGIYIESPERIPIDEEFKKRGETIAETLKEKLGSLDHNHIGSTEEDRIRWVYGLIEFFKFGIYLEEALKNPRIKISK